jgi:hypothetical protein
MSPSTEGQDGDFGAAGTLGQRRNFLPAAGGAMFSKPSDSRAGPGGIRKGSGEGGAAISAKHPYLAALLCSTSFLPHSAGMTLI